MAALRPREGGLRRSEHFGLRLATASAQCLRLSEPFFSFDISEPGYSSNTGIFAEGLFLRELHKIEPMQDESSLSTNDTDFYGFASVQSEDANPSQSRMQVSSFFKTRHNDIHQQHRYAAVSKLFVKFSTNKYTG